MSACFLALLLSAAPASAQVPVPSPEALQLEKLLQNSEQELKAVRELLELGKRDSASLEKADQILAKLSAGIEKSVERYQGTPVYEKALLKLQNEPRPEAGTPAASRRVENFQAQTVQANQADLAAQQKLAEALRTAEPGFVPKLQTQAELGTWQASTRVSAQLSELLAAIHELNAQLRARESGGGILSELIKGADIQNQKQREVMNRGPR